MFLRNDLRNEVSQKFCILFHCLWLVYLERLKIYRTVPVFIEKIDTEDGKPRVKYKPILRQIYHIPRVDANRMGLILKRTVPSRANHLIGAMLMDFPVNINNTKGGDICY